MNRVFGRPYKFNLYGHYTYPQQQQGISHVLTQIFHELKWRPANAITQYCLIRCHHWQAFLLHSLSADRTNKGSRALGQSPLFLQTSARIGDSLLLTLDQTAQGSRKERRVKWQEFGAPVLITPTSFHPGIHKHNIPKQCFFFFKICDLKQTVQSNEVTNKP